MACFKQIYSKGPTLAQLAIAWLAISSHVECAVASPHYRNNIYVIYATAAAEPESETNMPDRPSFDEYKVSRSMFFQDENSRALGSKLKLNERELLANEIFQLVKKRDMDNGFADPRKFAPAKHIFKALDEIKKSDMFYLLKAMPKGGVLHAHDTALTSTDYVVSLTYLPNLWICSSPDSNDVAFKFARTQPEPTDGLEWTLVADQRAKRGADDYDAEIRKLFTLYTPNPEIEYKDINHVWECFIGIFIKITPLLTYVPVWKAYYKQALKEFYEDGVQYLEFRGTLPDLYDLDGKIYKNAEVVEVYVEALEEFRAENPGFIGSKFVYAPTRKVDDATFAEYMRIVVDLKAKYPNFVVGFDIVSQEDAGRPLIDFAEPLLNLPNDISFYFHAGETNWNGMSTDENLIDAVLLGTKRIGHGYAILKHPKVLEAIRKKSIAIELNPISNQVLKLVDDNRNHPGGYLFADDYPVVVSSDDPSFWEATPLTHDFYIAFLGIASAHADLRTLKQLAINSLEYSSLNFAEKRAAMKKWEEKWNLYIEWVISQKSKYNL